MPQNDGIQVWSQSWFYPWTPVIIGKPGAQLRQYWQNPDGSKSPDFLFPQQETEFNNWLSQKTGKMPPTKGF